MLYLMFQDLNKAELINLYRDLLHTKLKRYPNASEIYEEIESQEHPCTRGNQLWFLNKADLIKMIYTAIIDEIITIDSAPFNTLKAMTYREWSCHQLIERIQARIKTGV